MPPAAADRIATTSQVLSRLPAAASRTLLALLQARLRQAEGRCGAAH
jgi:hypothetical protein